MAERSLADMVRLRSIFDTLKEPDKEWTEEGLACHLVTWERMNPRTVGQRLRDLRRLASHPLVPVKVHGTRMDLVDSFLQFMHHREIVEGKTGTAIANDFKAVKILAKYRGIPREVWPKPPPILEKANETLPSPEEIHALLHSSYAPDAKNSYTQHLIQYLLVLDFGFGPRMPSEAHALRIQDFDPDRHLITIREPKKSMRSRRLYVEPEWLCCGTNRPSLVHYLKWREKVDVGGTDAFFLKPNGEPFPTKDALRVFLEGYIRPKFPWYHGYLGRTWTTNARLIEWGFDYARVADWLGHESVEMVRKHYEKDARIHQKLYGDAWLDRAFRKPKSKRTVEAPKMASLSASSPVEYDAPAGI